jgi:hypothetical protein
VAGRNEERLAEHVNFPFAKVTADGRTGIELTRWMNGKHVLDSDLLAALDAT